MRKKVILLVMFIVTIVFQSWAQKNRVGITVNSLNYTISDIHTIDNLSNEKNKSLRIVPSFGYFRTIKKDIGFGLELGYQKSNYKRKTISRSSTDDNYEVDVSSNPYNLFYVCPSVFENYYWKKYQIITSIIVPFEYVTKSEYHSSQTFIVNNTDTSNQSFSDRTNPNTIFWGIFCNLGISRLICKNIYIGAQIGIGVTTDIRFGKGTVYYKRILNGVVVEEENTIQEFKKDYIGRLNYRPTISIHYNF